MQSYNHQFLPPSTMIEPDLWDMFALPGLPSSRVLVIEQDVSIALTRL